MLKTEMKILLIVVFIVIISIFTMAFGTEEAVPINEVKAENTVTKENKTAEEIVQKEPETKTMITKAKVLSAGEIYEETIDDMISQVQDVKIKILSGEHKDKAFDSKYMVTQDIDNKITAYALEKGDTVFVEITQVGSDVTNVVTQDLVRQSNLIYIIAVFFFLILVIGGIKGIKSIISLVITILIIYFITIKWILSGGNPILASIVTAALTIALTFIIVSGFNKKTLTASLGTIGGIAFSGVMAIIFGSFAKLSGFGEEAVALSITAVDMSFNFKEILYAGIIIASLGACMDVGMSIASALDEIKKAKDEITPKELMKSGIDIGKDVIGTMTNTLILAYVGASLNLILMFMAAGIPFADVINKETIVAEIVSAVSASMGVVFTIPITTFIYTLLNSSKDKYKSKPATRIDGERTLKI